MSWTAPRTWVTSEVVTSTIMNTHIRDNQLFLKQAKIEHPYGDARHLESGFYHVASAVKNTRYSSAVTFTSAFTSNPIIAVSSWNNTDASGANTVAPNSPCIAYIGGVSTSGFTIYLINASNSDPSDCYVEWLAFGTG